MGTGSVYKNTLAFKGIFALGAFGGPEKDRVSNSGESVLVHSVMATAWAASVVSTGATLAVFTLHGSFCFSTSGDIPASVDFDADGSPCLVCCPLRPAAGGLDSQPLLQ